MHDIGRRGRNIFRSFKAVCVSRTPIACDSLPTLGKYRWPWQGQELILAMTIKGLTKFGRVETCQSIRDYDIKRVVALAQSLFLLQHNHNCQELSCTKARGGGQQERGFSPAMRPSDPCSVRYTCRPITIQNPPGQNPPGSNHHVASDHSHTLQNTNDKLAVLSNELTSSGFGFLPDTELNNSPTTTCLTVQDVQQSHHMGHCPSVQHASCMILNNASAHRPRKQNQLST